MKKLEVKLLKNQWLSEDLESGQYGDPKVGNYDITSQNDNEAGDIEALSAAGLEEDIDIGHEDNEPGMLQGDLYQIGKSAMEIYALLDDMEGEGEVDLPSWWQAKIFKAKEAVVGAAEYLDFELKEPAIDAVVDKIEPLEIEVDPLGETVEDFITGVDDLTEIEIPSALLTKINAEVKSPKTFASLMINLYNAIQDKESMDFSKNQKFGRALSFLKDLADDDEETVDESFGSLAKKIDKQKGKSKKDAANIAGYVANIKRKGGGSGPTAKQKKRMAETVLKQIRK